MNVQALILAAGLSSRMKAFKPLLDIGDKKIVDHTLSTFFDAGIDQVVLVLGHEADRLRAHIQDERVRFVYNEDYSHTDMLTSIKKGLEQVDDDAYLFMTPVDIPLVDSRTVAKLLDVKADFIKPTYQGQSGHPILMSPNFHQALKSYNGPNGLRGFIEQSNYDIKKIEVDDPMILYDADHPEDYQRLLELFHSKVHLPKSVNINKS